MVHAARFEYVTEVLEGGVDHWNNALDIAGGNGWRVHTATWPSQGTMVVLLERPVAKAGALVDDGRRAAEEQEDERGASRFVG